MFKFLILFTFGAVFANNACLVEYDDLSASDFESSVVLYGDVGRKPTEPHSRHVDGIKKLSQLAFIPGDTNHVFFAEHWQGRVLQWNMKTEQLKVLVDLNLNIAAMGGQDDPYMLGLTGLAIHPNFEENKWFFVLYNPTNRSLKLSRFTYSSNNGGELINEKVLIEDYHKSYRNSWGGSQLSFDNAGNLFVALGHDAGGAQNGPFNNEQTQYAWERNIEATAANTNSLDGSFLRITPDNSAKGYSIPEGNFKEHFIAKAEGNLKFEYATKVLDEIYVKGNRTNWSTTTHPVYGWLGWGEVTNTSNDEFNIVKNPVFAGWPYFSENKNATTSGNPHRTTSVSTEWLSNDTDFGGCSHCVNNGYKQGVSMLPKVFVPQMVQVPGTRNGAQSGNSAMIGDFYVYDPQSGPNRFPIAFHNALFMYDFWIASPQMHVAKLTSQGDNVVLDGSRENLSSLISGVEMNTVIDAEFSPSGELFVLNHVNRGSGNSQGKSCPSSSCGSIEKISYKGAQCATKPTVNCAEMAKGAWYEGSGCPNPNGSSVESTGEKVQYALLKNELVFDGTGILDIEVYDIRGKKVFSTSGHAPVKIKRSSLLNSVAQGILFVQVNKSAVQKVIW